MGVNGNFVKATKLVCIVTGTSLLVSISAHAANPDGGAHASTNAGSVASETTSARPPAKDKVTTFTDYVGKARWVGRTLQYMGSDNKWANGLDAQVAAKDGSFLNGNDEIVEYQKGDVLFRTMSNGWFKASPDTVKLDDLIYGNKNMSPQEVAQARADYMAAYNWQIRNADPSSHLPNAAQLVTNIGVLAEGIGKAGPGQLPGTCHAANGSAALGDAVAAASDGFIYRVRVFNSPQGTVY